MAPKSKEQIINEKTYNAARAYVERIGMTILSDLEPPHCFLALDGADEVLVMVREVSQPLPMVPGLLMTARQDLIELHVLGEDKALLKHHRDYPNKS